MKKALIFIALLLVLPCAIWAAGIDVVVMVDTSESMFPVFDDVVDYLLRDLLENRLHQGDTFHLLTFADSPEEELQVEIEEQSDLESVIDRILLLKALGQYTDLVAAVDFLYEYTRALPEGNEKLILLLTDGVHDPPPGSPNKLDEKDVLARLLQSSEKIRREGWDVHILRMPGAEPAQVSPGEQQPGQDLLEELSKELETEVLRFDEVEKESLGGRITGFSTVLFPDPLGRIRRRFSATFEIRNDSAENLHYTLVGVDSAAGRLLRAPASVTVAQGRTEELVAHLRLPPGIEAGQQSLAVTLSFDDPQLRISPLRGELQFDYQPGGGLSIAWLRVVRERAASFSIKWGRIPLAYILYILAALLLIGVLILLFFVIRRRLQDAAFGRFFAGVVSTRRGKGTIRPLIMRVDSQNPNIGTRNIHSVPPGSRRSVGGDRSTFLIYYIPMPRRIGDIRNDGKRYSFVPKKPEYLEGVDKPIADCLDKPIRAVSVRGREVTFHFHEYVSPLEQINRLMRSVPRYHIANIPLKQPAQNQASEEEKPGQ